MPLTDAALARFRVSLSQARDDTVRLMAGLGDDIRLIVDARQDSNSDDEHDPEGSTLAFERSQSDALLQQSRQRLADIDAALGRLDDGSFGVCERCGRPIAEARLEARPYARLCIDCASLVG
ncbi:TraR/DksA family transcriptional regulator [Homoserinimonas aerilata]|uniref:TraR/DksA family transcriptional regulator n=1 Tax=Homoserinimonas aerilata TaxID=1162970 RepID=A0A542YGX6_9MICO|nr:TraR/DksA family transcriptional regulator [Homoserinimonas aerilata]TQL47234.1 TraR/DksA family transcriptional regulator [Homoserinimonas aerilata]